MTSTYTDTWFYDILPDNYPLYPPDEHFLRLDEIVLYNMEYKFLIKQRLRMCVYWFVSVVPNHRLIIYWRNFTIV